MYFIINKQTKKVIEKNLFIHQAIATCMNDKNLTYIKKGKTKWKI